MSASSFAAIFASAAPSPGLDAPVNTIERDLLARLHVARAAWPDLSFDEESFVRHLARHADESLPPIEHAAELWLVCACANGSPRAIAVLQERYGGAMERAARRAGGAGVAEEATQVTLASLLVRERGEPARITAYGGKCSLSNWLATVSARAAIKLRRGLAGRPHESVSRLTYAATNNQPELALLRAKYAPELETALRAALAELEVRPRVMLRLHYVERWSLERLAAFYEISRATAARRLAAARKELYDGTKRHLEERVGVTSSEFASIAALVGAELEVSVIRLLREDEPQEAEASKQATPTSPRASSGS